MEIKLLLFLKFIEFRGVQDTTLALYLCEGLNLGGRQLRFGRPIDYKLPDKHLLDFFVGDMKSNSKMHKYKFPQVKKNSPAWKLAMITMTQNNLNIDNKNTNISLFTKTMQKSHKSKSIT